MLRKLKLKSSVGRMRERVAMKTAFSTLGCPDWSLDRVLATARAHDFGGVELRALDGSLDLLAHTALQPQTIKDTRRKFAAHGISVCCVDTSCAFDAIEDEARARQIESALRHCELAAQLDAPLIRIFPDRIPLGATREETRERIAASLHTLAARVAAESDVRIGLETHGDFARVHETVQIVRAADHPRIAIIWDAANSYEAGDDDVRAAARHIWPYLAHVHLRDASPRDGGAQQHWRPVLIGRGDVPLSAVIETLRRGGYANYLSFEWEKYWQRDLEEPEVAIPDFAAAIKAMMNDDRGMTNNGKLAD